MSNMTFRTKLSFDNVPAIWIALIVVGAIKALQGRSPYFYPILHCEDGRYMLAHYFNNPAAAGIFRFYNGYVSIIPNAIGYVSAKLPLTWAPYVMAGSCWVITSIGFALFALRRYRYLVPDDRTRVYICIALALMPLGNFALLSTVAYSLWPLLWIAIMLLFAPIPSRRPILILQLFVMVLIACSHPVSLIMIPVAGAMICFAESLQGKLYYGLIVVAVLMYWRFGTSSGASPPITIETLENVIGLILSRALFEPLLGDKLRVALLGTLGIDYIQILCLHLLGGIWVLSCITRHHSPRADLTLLAGGAYLIVGLSALTVIGRMLNVQMGEWEQRYFYIQQLVFVLILLIGLSKRLSCRSLRLCAKVSGSALVVLYLTTYNYQNRQYFSSSIEDSHRLMSFLKDVRHQQKLKAHGRPYRSEMRLDRGGDWDMVMIP